MTGSNGLLRGRPYLRAGAWLLCACMFATDTVRGSPQVACDSAVLTLTEAAELLRVDPDTLRSLTERAEVPARRIGDAWRFNCAALMAWLNGDWEFITEIDRRSTLDHSSWTALETSDRLQEPELSRLTAAGTSARQDETEPEPAGPPTAPPAQDRPIGEAPDERTAEDIFLRGQRVLLAPGQFNFDFGQFYTERNGQQLALVDNGTVLGTVEQAAFVTTLQGRIGVGEETELLASTSYISQDSDVLSGSMKLASSSRSEFGDVRFGVRRTLLREGRGRPSIVGALDVRIPTGDTSYAIGGGLAFVKSIDPAALFASVNYRHTFSEEFADVTRLEPEERLDVNFGYALALNDTLSLSTSISAFFTGATRFSNTALTRQDGYSLSFGLTSWLPNGIYIEPGVSLQLGGVDDGFAFGVTVFTFSP